MAYIIYPIIYSHPSDILYYSIMILSWRAHDASVLEGQYNFNHLIDNPAGVPMGALRIAGKTVFRNLRSLLCVVRASQSVFLPIVVILSIVVVVVFIGTRITSEFLNYYYKTETIYIFLYNMYHLCLYLVVQPYNMKIEGLKSNFSYLLDT